MSRYTGPNCRLCRRAGKKLMLKGERCATPKCAVERRKLPPGQQTPRRSRISDYGVRLRDKQQAKHIYGMIERQFRNLFAEAQKKPGVTGDTLLQLLERRLDNVVYRLGFASSRSQARQLVRHGHIMVNGRKTDIPSCLVSTGDIINWKQQSTRTQCYQEVLQEIESRVVPVWLSLDRQNLVGKVLTLPSASETEATFDTKAIVEYYSR